MPWTKTRYPVSMKNLPAAVRNKAIEIANALLDETSMDEGILIATSISRAKDWAENHGKQEEDRLRSHVTDVKSHGKDRYVVPYANSDWAVKEEGEKEVEKIFHSKKEAIAEASKEAKRVNGAVTVQARTGQIERRISFNPANSGKKQK